MPFVGDVFKLLPLQPYNGPLASQLENLASGISFLKTNAATIDAASLIAAVPGAPADNQIIKYDATTSTIHWSDDETAAGGMSDGVVSSINFTTAGNTVTATLSRTNSLANLTGNFDVFSGAYSDLSGLPILFSGSYPDLTNKPTIPPATPANRLIPPGGTAAQVLTKVDANDYEVNWTTIPTGGGGGGTPPDITAAEIIDAVAGTPSAALNVIKWGTGGTLTWSADAQGMGGGGAAGRTLIGTIASSNAQTAVALTLDEALSGTTLYRATLTDSDGTVATADFLGAELLGLSETTAPPTSDNNSLLLSMSRPGTLTGSAATVVRIWNGDSSTGIYAQKSRTDTQVFRLYKVVYEAAGGGGGGSGDDAFPWATEGNIDKVPDNKLNDLILTRIDGFTYIPASRNIVLTLERLDGTTNIAQVQIPEFLAPATVEPFALTANPNITVPAEKLPTHIVAVAPLYDDQTKILGIQRTTTAGSIVTSNVTLPNWIEASDVQQWAKAGDTSRLPYNKLPSLLRSAHTITYDEPSRELAILFRNTDLVDVELTVTLPNFVTSVTGFDLHDSVTTAGTVMDPDRFVFSDENVAGDPMRYIRADNLADYVIGKIVPADIPASIARDDEIEEWARVGNPMSLIPFQKFETTVVRSIGAFTFDPASERLTITTLLSSGTFESTHVDFPDYITSAAVENWAKVGDGSQIPVGKIPNLSTGKITGLGEFLEDRVGNQLIQHGTNLVWTYDDAAGQLTGNVTTNLADVTQIIRDVVNPLGPGLTESFNTQLNRLNIGLDIDTIIQVGSNMTKSVVAGVITLNSTGSGGAGISLQDALDGVGGALVGGSKIGIAVGSGPTTYTFSTTALNAAEVNTRIDTRILSLLPTVTAGEASIDDGDERRIWTSRRVRQAANLSAQTHIVGVASPIDVADPTTNTDVFAASKQSVAQAIFDNMGTGGGSDGIVNSLDLSRSGRNLTVTLGRSIGADLAETVQLPEDENRFVDSLGVLVTGQTLTVTLGRTAPLPDLVDTATIPTGGMGGGTDTNDFVTGGAFTLSGQELSLRLTGTPGFTTIDFPAITLPTGGGGGGGATPGRTMIGQMGLGTVTTAQSFALDEAIEDDAFYRIVYQSGSFGVTVGAFYGSEVTSLSSSGSTPTGTANSIGVPISRQNTITNSASTNIRLWKGADNSNLYIQKPRSDNVTVQIWKIVLAGSGGGGGTDTNNYLSGVTSSVAGQIVTLNFAREGLANLATDFTVPGGGSGDDAFPWATVGNPSLVPTDKLGPGVANADRILRGNQTWGRINANTLTANFLTTGSPDEADYMLFADSGPGRQLSFITYSGFLDGIAGAGLIHGGETLHLDATGATTGQVFSYTGDGTTLNFEWIDLPTGGGGGGTDDQTASEVPVDTSGFSQNLTAADDTVQAALETIDSFSQYQGAWQPAPWPAGVITTRSGIAYISLVNSNTQFPTPASTQWSGLPEGFTYRGEAPVAATNYNYGHFTFDPDTEKVFVFKSTISASVARADIPTHADFIPLAITVESNPSGTPTAQLNKVTIGAKDYQVRSTEAVKYLSDRPVADLSTVGHVYHVLQEGQAFFGVEDSHQSATPTGTFNNIPNRSDLHVVATLPTNLNNLTTGDFYYHAGGDPSRGGYEFYEVVVRGTKQLQNVHASRALSASRSNNSFNINWLGSNADSTVALAFTDAISSTANYFFHNETTGNIQRLDNTTYSGPSVQPHYRWLGIGGSGGGGGSDDGVADSVDLSLSGSNLTVTVGRSVGADLTDSVALPSVTDTNDYVDGVVMALGSSGSLSVTLERTGSLADLTAVIDLPEAGLSEVAHDDTLFGVGTVADPLGVSAHDVLEQFAESVQYFTDSTSLNTGNFAAKGPRFTTGNYEFHVTAVEMEYNPGNVEYFARIVQLNDTDLGIAAVLGSSPHYQDTGVYITKKMKFRPSVRIPANSRIAILLIRRHAGASDIVLGSESSNSPDTSFPLASTDWVHEGNVRINSVNPVAGESVGNFSNSNVAGNCKIYYTHPFSQYLPEGSVGARNIDSGNATLGQVLTADGSAGASWEDAGGGTLTVADIPDLPASKTTSGRFNVGRIAWAGSQTAYDALTADANTMYLITS